MRLPLMRYKIHCLMAILLYTAIGLAALRSSSYLWLRAVNTLVLAILFISILAATHGRGPKRAFWLGYALFGWGYYFLVFGPWEGWPSITDIEAEVPRGEILPNLLTRDLVKFVTARTTSLPDITATGTGAPGAMAWSFSPGAEKFPMMQLCSSWIGHLLLTLLIGSGGGLISFSFAITESVSGPEP